MMRIAIELLVAAFLLLLMLAAAYVGMLMNFLFLALLACLSVGELIRIACKTVSPCFTAYCGSFRIKR
jgi:hypothetical protein